MRLHLVRNSEWDDWEVQTDNGYQVFASDNYSEARDFMVMAQSAMDYAHLKLDEAYANEFVMKNPIGIINIAGVKQIDPNVRRNGPQSDRA